MRVPAKSLKILLVDADEVFRGILKDILLSEQHRVVTAVNGLDALRQLTPAAGIDLIISAVDMPEMGGLEMLRAVREKNDTIPIIVLIGNRQLKVAMEALKNGANDYLLKNDNLKDTAAITIGKVLEKHRLTLENQRLEENLARKSWELERLSLLDGLTGLANRKYFDRILQQEWSRATREHTPLTMILVAVDHFKLYIDTYGPQQGDLCLQQVAAALSSSLRRAGDFTARYGNEELVAVLPDTDQTGGGMLAERIRGKVLQLAIEHRASPICPHVTVSLGVAVDTPKHQVSSAMFIRMAENVLRAAQQSGGNRVQIAAPDRSAAGHPPR